MITINSKIFTLTMSLILLGCGDDSDAGEPHHGSFGHRLTTGASDSGGESDDEPTESGEGSGGDTTAADDPSSTAADAAPSESSAGSDEGSADSDGAAFDDCVEQATNECEVCSCTNCFTELVACEADPGCVAILTCARETGCVGIGCFDVCSEEIDEAGGELGDSVLLLLEVGDCYQAASCDSMCSNEEGDSGTE